MTDNLTSDFNLTGLSGKDKFLLCGPWEIVQKTLTNNGTLSRIYNFDPKYPRVTEILENTAGMTLSAPKSMQEMDASILTKVHEQFVLMGGNPLSLKDVLFPSSPEGRAKQAKDDAEYSKSVRFWGEYRPGRMSFGRWNF
jgi:hypothetical protein